MAGMNETMSSMRPMGFGQMFYEGLRKDKKKPVQPTIAGGSFGLSDARPASPIAASGPSVGGVALERFK